MIWIVAFLAAEAPLALVPIESPPTLTLADAWAAVEQRGVAVRTARAEEEVALAQRDRAFSLLLPRVDAEANYVFSCQIAGGSAVDCADQQVQFIGDDFLRGQEFLFQSVAEGTRARAGVVAPEQQPALLAQADALDAAGAAFGATDNTPTVIAPAHVVSGSVTLSVPLVLMPAWSALASANDAAQFRKEVVVEATRQAKIGVALLWLQAVRQAEVVTLTRVRLADAKVRVAAVERAVALGTTSELVVDGAKLEELAAESALMDATTAAAAARARLGVLIGRNEEFVASGEMVEQLSTMINVDDGVIERAVAGRIEAKAAALQQRIAEREGDAAWFGYAPELRAFAQLRGTTNVGGFIQAPFATGVGVALKWNLFDGGERQGRVVAAVAQTKISAIKQQDLQLAIAAEIRGALLEGERAHAKMSVAERAVALARSRLAAVELAIATGVRSDVDLSAAAATRHAAEVDHVSARIGVAAAAIALRTAAGGAIELQR
jgi:outer membrane protein TolC